MMRCRHCGKRLPLLRKLQDGEFCSDKHRTAFSQGNDELALARLIENPAQRAASNSLKLKPAKPSGHGRAQTPLAFQPLAPADAHIGLYRLHPEDEHYRVRPLDGDPEVIRPHLPTPEREVTIPTPTNLLGAWQELNARSQAPMELRIGSHPDIEAELRAPGFAKSGEATHVRDLLTSLASRVPLPGVWMPGSRSGSTFLRPDTAPYRRQSHYRLPRLNCPLRSDQAAMTGLSRDILPVTGENLIPLAAGLICAGSGLSFYRDINRRPAAMVGGLVTVLTPVKWTSGVQLGRATMPHGGEVDLRPYERVFGNRHPVLLLEGGYLGTRVSVYPTLDALLGRRRLAGAPRLPLSLPVVRIGSKVSPAAEFSSMEEFRGPVAMPSGYTLADPMFRAPLGSLCQLALASRNPLRYRSCQQEIPPPLDLDAPALVTPSSRKGPDYLGIPGSAAILTLGPPASQRYGNVDEKGAPSVFEHEWPEQQAPANGLRVAEAGSSERAPALTETLWPLSLDQAQPLGAPLSPKGEWEPEATAPLLILSSSRLLLREERLESPAEAASSRWAQPWQAASAAWQQSVRVPKWVTASVMTVLMTVGLALTVPSAHGTPDSADLSAWAKLQKTIMDRAAIALTDDFRTGLASWEGTGDWAKSWSYDATGFVRTGDLALYAPTTRLRDYRVEFLAQIEKKALSWVVRAADLNNYQVVKVVLLDSGPVPKAEIARYAVIDGKREPESRKPLPMGITRDTIYRVSLDLRGDDVVLAMQGKVIDIWSEPRLARGGIGFFSAPGERARLRWVGVWHQYDTLGRLCAYLSPYSMPDRERSMGQ